jgi:hypothetical protein
MKVNFAIQGNNSEREEAAMARTDRRTFLIQVAAGAASLRASPNERVTVGVMGFRGRGRSLLEGFLALPEVDIAALCDVDAGVLARGVAMVEKARNRRPTAVADFRRLLDERSVDALVIATPDHWHAIPTILACQAGKHVYVEKPASHNIREGTIMVRAAQRYNRVVQVGCQSRSGRHFAEAVAYIRGSTAFANLRPPPGVAGLHSLQRSTRKKPGARRSPERSQAS